MDMKKTGCCLLLAFMLLLGYALAEQEVRLTNSRYAVLVPDDMEYSAPLEKGGVEAYISEDLEMDYTAYLKADAIRLGMGETLRETAEERAGSGLEVELRLVNGVEMLCYRIQDDTDGTPCIGYIFDDGDWRIEVDFWYATQEAADRTIEIISSVHEVPMV